MLFQDLEKEEHSGRGQRGKGAARTLPNVVTQEAGSDEEGAAAPSAAGAPHLEDDEDDSDFEL